MQVASPVPELMNNKREVKIYCPKCSWEPSSNSCWFCTDCGHGWNTFETAATCPACGHTHEKTQCLSCHKSSPHSDWYHDFTHTVLEEEEVLLAPLEH